MPDPLKVPPKHLAAVTDLILAGRRLGLDTPEICTGMLLAIERMGGCMEDGERWDLAVDVYTVADGLALRKETSS